MRKKAAKGTKIDSADLYQTAIHEAGHAVAKIALRRHAGEVFHAVHVFPDNHGKANEDIAPYVDWKDRTVYALGLLEGPSFWNSLTSMGMQPPQVAEMFSRGEMKKARAMALDSMKREVAVAYAVPIAELRHTSPRVGRENTVNCVVYFLKGGDADHAERAMADYRAVTRREPYKSIARDACDLVRANWAAITALADALMVKNTIEYDEACKIVEPLLAPPQGLAKSLPAA